MWCRIGRRVHPWMGASGRSCEHFSGVVFGDLRHEGHLGRNSIGVLADGEEGVICLTQ
jgi:hypothetical protein